MQNVSDISSSYVMKGSSSSNTASNNSALPLIASDVNAHVAFLVERASKSRVFGKREATGGIIPIVRDPNTKITHILLGLNHARHYCHFHGWVDPDETQDQGAAREAFEESKGLLGDLCSLWRAVVCKGVFSAHLGRGGMNLVHFGDMNEVERAEMEEKFLKLQAWSTCSDEVIAVTWFDTLSLRHACLNREHKGADIYIECDVRKNIRRKLRGFLADIFADPQFWSQEVLRQSVDKGFVPLIPISFLPKIEDENVLRRLPYCLPPSTVIDHDRNGDEAASDNLQHATETPTMKK